MYTPENITLSYDESQSLQFPVVPADTYFARCVDVVYMGFVPQKIYQSTKYELVEKVRFYFEVTDETDEDGNPYIIRSRGFKMSLHTNAGLRKFLESWRGKAFTKEELQGFNLVNLINAPASITVGHTPRNDGSGNVWVNINTIAPLKKKIAQHEQVSGTWVRLHEREKARVPFTNEKEAYEYYRTKGYFGGDAETSEVGGDGQASPQPPTVASNARQESPPNQGKDVAKELEEDEEDDLPF